MHSAMCNHLHQHHHTAAGSQAPLTVERAPAPGDPCRCTSWVTTPRACLGSPSRTIISLSQSDVSLNDVATARDDRLSWLCGAEGAGVPPTIEGSSGASDIPCEGTAEGRVTSCSQRLMSVVAHSTHKLVANGPDHVKPR